MKTSALRKILLALFTAASCSWLAAQSQAPQSTGNVWAWGDNGFSELGNGTTVATSTPSQTSNLSGVVAIADGCCDDEFSLALKSDGTVWAWGGNGFGELGIGTNAPSSTPIVVSGLSGVIAIAAGWDHSLAVKSDGTVWAWGTNANGELGNGSTTNSNIPVQVSSLSGVIAVAAGGSESMALKSDGTVWVWGYNGNGQLGLGTASAGLVTTPVQISSLSGVVAVAAGNGSSLVLKNDGTVWAWGYNLDGRLGNGTTTGTNTPVQTSNLSGVVAIAAADGHSLALKGDGTVWAWGSNGNGELGNGMTTNSSTPVQVSSLSAVTTISAGSTYSMAAKSDGTLWTWGFNGQGQLGVGTKGLTPITTPVQVSSLSGITGIAAGDIFSLVVQSPADGATTHFSLALPASATAGSAVTFTVTALNASSQIVLGYTGTIHFTSTDSHAVLPLDYTFTPADNGTHVFSVTFDTSGTQTISVTAPINSAVNGSGNTTVNPEPTTTLLSASTNPSVFGQQVSFTALVTPVSSSSLTPTGNVTFSDGAIILGTIPISSGIAIFNTSSLSVGTHSITAAYGGDSNFAPSTSSALSQVVNQAGTATTLSASPSPSTFGQSVTLTATVVAVAPGAGSPSGTVTFLDGANSLATVPLNAAANATFSTSSLTSGSHTLTATYNGNSDFLVSTSAPISLTVQGATHLAVSPPASATAGAPFSVTVTALDASNNQLTVYTGTVCFTSTDPQAILPSCYTFTPADHGAHVFTGVTLNTPGSQTITATDGVDAITGSSAPISVASPPPPVVQITDNETITVSDADSFPDVFDVEAVHVTDAAFVTPLIAVTAPVAEYSTGGLGFGGQSGSQTITVSNIGEAPLTIASATISGSGSGQFNLAQISCSNSTASLSTVLPSGGACTVTINYAASLTPATDIVALVFIDNAGLSNLPTASSGAGYTQSVSLSGGGTNTGPPPPPPATISVAVNETVHVLDAISFPDVFDGEVVHVQDQVNIATLQAIRVIPANSTIANGATESFTAIGAFSDGSTQDLTALVTWSSSNLAVATLNRNVATAVGIGQTSITATLGSISGSTTLFVRIPFLRITAALSSIKRSASGGYNVTISVTNTGDIAANNVTAVLSILGAAITRTSTPSTNLLPGATGTVTLAFPSSAGASGSTQALAVVGLATGTDPNGTPAPPALWLLPARQVTLP